MMKSYKLNEWPKTVIHDQVPVQLHISLPQHNLLAQRQLGASRIAAGRLCSSQKGGVKNSGSCDESH